MSKVKAYYLNPGGSNSQETKFVVLGQISYL
jgi:hypothetical protein